MDILSSILALLTGIGVFLTAITLLTESLKKNYAQRMRGMFKKIGNNRFAGVGIGTGATAIVQSSSAITVMTVGLVSIGVLNLFQATSIIMGANIGTALSNLLIGASFSLSSIIKPILMSLAGFGVIIKMASKKQKVQMIGEITIYLGLLFVGLNLMSAVFSDREGPVVVFFSALFEKVTFPLILILIGALFTIIIQSSTASMGIYIAMVASGVMPLKTALFLMLGSEMGTCFTALLASLNASRNAKRAALVHLLYNVFGTILFASILWPLYDPIMSFYAIVIPNEVWRATLFSLINNIVSVGILIWFIKPFNRLICWLVKDKLSEEEQLHKSFIDENLLQTPAIAVEKALKEVHNMAVLSRENFDRAFDALINADMTRSKEIANCEYKIDFLTGELSAFFVKISSSSISLADSKLIGSLHHVINSIERIGDHAVTFAKETNYMKQLDIGFIEESKIELKEIYSKVCEIFDLSLITFETRKTEHFNSISALHQEIKSLVITFRDNHIFRLSSNKYSVEVGKSFYTALLSLQRVADHAVNVAFSIRSYTGNKNEALQNVEKENKKSVSAKA